MVLTSQISILCMNLISILLFILTEFLTKRLITHYLDPWFSEHYSKFTDSLFLRLGDLSALFSDFIPSLHSQYIKHHLEIFTLFKPQ